MTDNVVMNCTHYWVVDDVSSGFGQVARDPIKRCLKCGAREPHAPFSLRMAEAPSPHAVFDASPEIDDDALAAVRTILRAGILDVRVLPWNLLAGLVRRLDETLKRGLERDEQLDAQTRATQQALKEKDELRDDVRVLNQRFVELERALAEYRARDEARGGEPVSEGTSTNHEEAEQLAHLRQHHSNLARCYLDLLRTLDKSLKSP